MCCLGQFSLQLNKKLSNKDIVGVATPGGTLKVIPKLSRKIYKDRAENTELSSEAMKINDNKDITTEERISKLKELFKEHNFIIRVINLPK